MRRVFLILIMLTAFLEASIGEITAKRGQAEIVRNKQKLVIEVGTKLEEGDVIYTSKKSKLQIRFNDDTIISLGQNSKFTIDEYLFDKKKPVARFRVGRGFFKSITGKIGKIAHKNFKIKTANATIGVRGTTIIAQVAQKRDIIACSQGQIVVTSLGSSVTVNAGERTIVDEAKAPRVSQKINKILLKQLDKKSDPSTVEEPIEKETTTIKSTKEVQTQSSLKKEDDKFTPWAKNDDIDSLSDIQNIVGEQKPVYEGQVVSGKTNLGDIAQDTSSVKLGFDLGSGAMDGKIKFNDTVNDYDIDVAGKLKGDGSFDFNSNNGYDGKGKGSLNGTQLEHASGSFDFNERDINTNKINNLTGKFGASRK